MQAMFMKYTKPLLCGMLGLTNPALIHGCTGIAFSFTQLSVRVEIASAFSWQLHF
jgi:hypothetical protein